MDTKEFRKQANYVRVIVTANKDGTWVRNNQ